MPPGTQAAGTLPGFLGFRPWLARRGRVLYVRQGTLRERFVGNDVPRGITQVRIESSVPKDTWIKARLRVALPGGSWSEWRQSDRAAELPAGREAEVEVTLHTDDGYVSPSVRNVAIEWHDR